MDEFARRDAADRLAYVSEAAARRDIQPFIVEKDFWVAWTLRRLTRSPALAGHLTFKGGTSLSKAYGLIERFSEDVDLTIASTAPLIGEVPSPMGEGISNSERRRRIDALKAAAQTFVASLAKPALEDAIAESIGTNEGWSVELDLEDQDAQTLLFHYPSPTDYGPGYIRPRIKLELGARGETEPHEIRSISPLIAAIFPDELLDAATEVQTLSAVRTFWEKATILHALYHGSNLRPAMSRHYYDLVMMARQGIDVLAIEEIDLLARVVRNKSLMFADAKAGYDQAKIGSLRLAPTADLRSSLERDYEAMAVMFMAPPPTFAEVVDALKALERKLNAL